MIRALLGAPALLAQFVSIGWSDRLRVGFGIVRRRFSSRPQQKLQPAVEALAKFLFRHCGMNRVRSSNEGGIAARQSPRRDP